MVGHRYTGLNRVVCRAHMRRVVGAHNAVKGHPANRPIFPLEHKALEALKARDEFDDFIIAGHLPDSRPEFHPIGLFSGVIYHVCKVVYTVQRQPPFISHMSLLP